MQPIERVGVFALLFLVVTVVAVVLWDKSPDEPESGKGATARERAQSESKASPRTTHDPVERGLGQLDDSITKPNAKLLAGPREPLPMASTREGVLPPAKKPTPGDAGPTGLARGADAQSSTSAAGPSALVARDLAKRDFGPETPSSAPSASAPTTLIVPRVAERSPSSAVHVVKPGETLSDIATERLGQASRWREIADLNGVDPARLHVGKELRLPAGAAATPSPTPSKGEASPSKSLAQTAVPSASTYRVQSGDSMWRIAERELGAGERWNEIASLNRGVDANRLVAGATLTLPAGRRSTTVVPAPAKAPPASAKSGTTLASAGAAKKKGTVR